ncbi:MAG: hypothetical protein NVSMB6_21980 [Burkholderiaceae bacterium]
MNKNILRKNFYTEFLAERTILESNMENVVHSLKREARGL